METKLKQVHSEYATKVKVAAEHNKLNSMLATCSPADKEAIGMLEKLDIASGGGLLRLVAIYTAIKQSSFHVDGRDG
ncbi:MAG: hypothetical protein HC930_04125 [Hydrococcus sp. SU_1_0]|nr:hypothetical protein [Hydrococcus sp. SU_1_0]